MFYHAPMKIGRLSNMTGVSIDTIRYYEQRGLIPIAERSESGYRQYSVDDVKRLKFIVQAKELGFTLEETGQLLAIRSDGRACAEVRAVAEAKADEISSRIRKLSRMHQILLNLAEQCEKSSDSDSCPILESLEDAA